MPTFPAPVALADFQTYLKDSSVDPVLLDLYSRLLETATESVYTWLNRDYTPSAPKTDRFWGDDTQFYAPQDPVGTLLSWTYTDLSGVTADAGITDLLIRGNGYLVQALTKTFVSGAEHTLSYAQPATLVCPETVKQVIIEIAAVLFDQSNQGSGSLGLVLASAHDGVGGGRERFIDLSDRHKEMLRPYKRYPV